MTNFSDMLSKAKIMQEKMREAQDQIKKIEVEGMSGGNLVKVILKGDYELKTIEITEAAKKEEGGKRRDCGAENASLEFRIDFGNLKWSPGI